MSNSLAIAAVTSSVRYLLDRALQRPHLGPVGGAKVTTLRPDALAGADLSKDAGVNVYCYLATPNHAWNLTDLPTRRSDGTAFQRPVAALDLHYLITCFGDEAALEPERLLGRAVGALSGTSMLARDVVNAAIDLYRTDTDTAFLDDSDLASEVELVKLSPMTLSLEEMSKLWGVLDTPYQLSLTYLATVVLIAAEVTPTVAFPVRTRSLTVTPSGPVRLVQAGTEPPGQAVGNGTTLQLRGSRLLAGPGLDTRVRIGPATLVAEPGGTAAELAVVLTDAVPAGVLSAHVTHHEALGPTGPRRTVASSNSMPLVVRPAVAVDAVTSTDVTLAFSPPLQQRQRVTILLSRLSGGAEGEPGQVTVALPPVETAAAPVATLTFAHADVPDGTWLVRAQVDGIDSLPDSSGEVYDEPSLTLPPSP